MSSIRIPPKSGASGPIERTPAPGATTRRQAADAAFPRLRLAPRVPVAASPAARAGNARPRANDFAPRSAAAAPTADLSRSFSSPLPENDGLEPSPWNRPPFRNDNFVESAQMAGLGRGDDRLDASIEQVAPASDCALDIDALAGDLLPMACDNGIFEVTFSNGATLGVVVNAQAGHVSYLLSPANELLGNQLRQKQMELKGRLERRIQRNVRITVL